MKRWALRWRQLSLALALTALLAPLACTNTPVDVSEHARGPAPLRMPSPAQPTDGCGYEDALQGHQVFNMYCAACHNARPLAERPFSSYQNVAQHMRVRANLTGKEYAELMAWLRRWHDVPPPNEGINEPSPKRFFFSQPIQELRPQPTKTGAELPARPGDGSAVEGNPMPPPVNSPGEPR